MVSFSAAAAFIRFSGFSVSSVVNLMSSLTMKIIVSSGTAGTIDSLSALIGYFIYILISFSFLALAFSFLASFGYFRADKRFSLIVSAIGGCIFFLFLGFSVASLIVAAGIFVSSYMIIPMANNYGRELKKWVHFRLGSNSVSRALFVFNLFAALAVFSAVLMNQAYYGTSFRTDLRQTMVSVVGGSLPSGIDPSAMAPLIGERIDQFLDSPLIAAYINWLPVVAAFSVWALLEILKMFLPYLAGLFSAALIKIEDM